MDLKKNFLFIGYGTGRNKVRSVKKSKAKATDLKPIFLKSP